jgi:hypothetical protein
MQNDVLVCRGWPRSTGIPACLVEPASCLEGEWAGWEACTTCQAGSLSYVRLGLRRAGVIRLIVSTLPWRPKPVDRRSFTRRLVGGGGNDLTI